MNPGDAISDPRKMESQEANEVLAILDTYNFTGCFESWVVSETTDRINVVVNAGKKMQIHADLVCAFSRLFPVRSRGPFLGADTLTFEFTKTMDEDREITHQNKRARVDTSTPALLPNSTAARPDFSSAASSSAVDTKIISETLLPALQKSLALYNNRACTIELGENGQDDQGAWCTFQLRFSDRVNLLFCVHAFATAHANMIKDMWILLHPTPHILIRPFTGSDRRIVSTWEIVPAFPSQGNFTMLRHKRIVL